MRRYFLIVILFICIQPLRAQQDTLRSNTITKQTLKQPIILSKEQQNWLGNNYSRLGNLKKQQARTAILKEFPAISEASLEYMIGEAGRLLKGDRSKEIALLNQRLSMLKEQKNVLAKKITEKEGELKKTTLADQRASITKEIQDLKTQLGITERSISDTENRIGP